MADSIGLIARRWIRCFVAATVVGMLVMAVAQAAPTKTDDATKPWSKGLVRWDKQWLSPEDVAQRDDVRAALDEYQKKREAAAQTVDGQLQLANWCEKHKLEEQERAHLMQVLDLDPTHAEARRRLGYVLVDGMWMSRDEMRRSRERAKDAEVALKRWSGPLRSLAAAFSKPDEKAQSAAKAKLMQIHDSSAIPAMELMLGSAGDAAGLALVDALAAMTTPDASVSLARLAINSPSKDVRRAATKKLKDRPLEYYVPALLSTLVTPIEAKVDLYCAPDGRLNYRHWFFAETDNGKRATVVDQSFRRAGGGVVQNGAQLTREETALALAATQQSLAAEDNNERICTLLSKVADLDLPAKPEVWWSWWNDKTETYLAEEKPIYRQYVARESVVTDTPRYYGGTVVGGTTTGSPRTPSQHECLIAGTPVWTVSGLVAVEKIQVGDLVLAQDIETGELTFKPVLRTTVRPPAPLVVFKLPKDTITCSGGHLFWAEGKGWLRARQIEPGVALHTIGDAADVQTTDAANAQKTYNLIVADFHTYFVGESKLLSHDNTVRRATAIATPGEPAKAVKTASAK